MYDPINIIWGIANLITLIYIVCPKKIACAISWILRVPSGYVSGTVKSNSKAKKITETSLKNTPEYV